MNPTPPSSSAMERTRLQAFKELRSMLSEVLASAVADEEVPEAFKEKSNWDKLIAQTEQRLAEGWKQRFDTGMERRAKPRQLLDLLPPEEEQQQLLSERFINEVSYQGRHSLDELDRQLSAMSGAEHSDGGPNPLGPLAWVEGLRGGIREIRCTPEERDWLLARLVPLLISRITGFYSTLTTQISHSGYPGRPGRSGGGGGASAAMGASGGGNNAYSPDLVPSINEGQSVFGGGGGSGGGGDGGVPTEGGEVLDRLFGLLSARRGGPEFGAPAGMPGAWPQGGQAGFPGGAPGYPMGGSGFPGGGQGFPGGAPMYPGGEGGGGFAPGPGFGGMPGYGPPPGPGGYPVFPLGGAPMVPGVPGIYPAYGPTVPNNYPGMPGGVPLGPSPGGYPAGEGGEGQLAEGGMPGMMSAPAGPVVPWSQNDIFSVLSLLQGSYAASYGRGTGSVVGHLHEAIGSTASQLGLAGGIQAMPGPAQDMLELVSMLFEALLDGRRLDEKARSQLARLVIPYVRVAMLDRRLFMQSSHPARRVLNLLVEAFETAAPEVSHYRNLRELAFDVVERIINEFDDNLRLFEKFEDLLANELEAGRRRADLAERRAADAQTGKERRQVAREAVSHVLSEAIVGKSLPPVLLDFLAGPWQHHHTVVMLREGELGEGVLLSRGLLDDLLRANEAGALDNAPRLRPVVVEVLASSGQPGSAADELLIELSLALAVRGGDAIPDFEPRAEQADAAESADSATLVPVVLERVLVESPAIIIQHTPAVAETEGADDAYVVVSEIVAAELPAEIVERYVNYPIGTWLDFVGEDGRVTSARISWTSPISGRRILSNRRGQRMLVASPEELAEMELEGRIRPRHSESAFDQALHTIADRLEASKNRPASAA